MKTYIIKNIYQLFCLSILFFPLTIEGQDTIQSEKLDSMIWKKINDYRVQLNVPKATIFERGLMRSFSRRVTNGNVLSGKSVHSDSVGYFCNTECLFQLIYTGNSPDVFSHVEDFRNGKFDYLAERAVEGWKNSPSHNRLITKNEYTISTITSMIIITPLDNGYKILFETSHHSLSNQVGATFTDEMDAYVAKLIKKGH